MVVVEQAARLTDTCEECCGTREGWVVQLVKDGKLRWEIEWECPGIQISHQWVWGPAPAQVRALLIERHGVEYLKVVGGGAKKGVLLKVFREVFGSSISEAKEFSQSVTSSGYEGTRVEVDLLAKLLSDRGVEVEMGPGLCG